ncbi:MAG: hypothetical protein ACTSRZ_09950 [Promethearchaeota archaeon]
MGKEIEFESNENEFITKELKEILCNVPELEWIIIFDLNGRVISSGIPSSINQKKLGIINALSVLSLKNFLNMFRTEEFKQFYIRLHSGYFFFFKMNRFNYLALKTDHNIKLGLLYLEANRLIKKLIPYLTHRSISSTLKKELNNFEESILKNYRLFFSYALKDSDDFKIREIAKYWEENYDNVQIRYFERDKKVGIDILDYMESGIAWCNRFIWFHSENSEDSEAVKQEYKMAQLEGKKIFTITKNPSLLQISAKANEFVIWKDFTNINLDDLIQRIIKL